MCPSVRDVEAITDGLSEFSIYYWVPKIPALCTNAGAGETRKLCKMRYITQLGYWEKLARSTGVTLFIDLRACWSRVGKSVFDVCLTFLLNRLTAETRFISSSNGRFI